MKHTPDQLESDPRVQPRLGVAALTRVAFQGRDLAPVASKISSTLVGSEADAAALMDLSVIEQLCGHLSAGLDHQSAALAKCRLFETVTNINHDLDLLILAAPIHMGGNTPIDFLLANSKIRQTTLYMAQDAALPSPLPAHDVTFIAAPGDADATRQYLEKIKSSIADWPTLVLNNPDQIAGLDREQLFKNFTGQGSIAIPATIRCDRQTLTSTASGHSTSIDELDRANWPLVIRPVGSHAGLNLEKLSGPADLQNYLSACKDSDFFVSEFIDYRSADGQFRKYRIVFVDGHPFPCHMAIADKWKIWYLNADMQQSPAKRAEEEEFMANFSNGFALRNKTALSVIPQEIDLDYFGIDCAELPDGRMVVFEADNALIVHDMDPPQLFPYKLEHMQDIFSAFQQLIYAKAGRNLAP